MEQEEKGTQLASQGRRSAVELCPQLESPSSLYSSPGWTAASGSPREGGFIDALGLSGPTQRMLGTQGISGAVSLGLGSPLKPKSLCKGCPAFCNLPPLSGRVWVHGGQSPPLPPALADPQGWSLPL